jgi:glycosyltransferase involved in cell wall biosynthesis
MKILHVISSIDPRKGGPTTALAGMAEAQAAEGLDVTLVATFQPNSDHSTAQQMQRRGVTVHLIGPVRGPLASHRQIKPTVRKHVAESDIVHIHAMWEDIQHHAAIAAHSLGRPYVISPHGMLDPWSLSQGRWKKRLYLALRQRRNLNRAAALCFTTETERRLTEPLGLRPPSIVEPLGIDLSEFEGLPRKGAFRSRYPEIGDRPMLLYLSRIHPKKGLDLLIPAFASLENERVMLVIAGPDSDDGYKARVEQMARDRHVPDRVVFTGMLYGAERIEAMVDADLLTLPSYQENFGIVVPESLAAGTPVVISDQVNMHDFVTRGEVGEVVPTDVARLTDALNRWMTDEILRSKAAARCRPFVWEHFDWRQIARRWKNHYADVVEHYPSQKTASPA